MGSKVIAPVIAASSAGKTRRIGPGDRPLCGCYDSIADGTTSGSLALACFSLRSQNSAKRKVAANVEGRRQKIPVQGSAAQRLATATTNGCWYARAWRRRYRNMPSSKKLRRISPITPIFKAVASGVLSMGTGTDEVSSLVCTFPEPNA